MPQSLSKVLVHIVFSTKDRVPFLQNTELRNKTHAFLGGICKKQRCIPLKIGGVADHVHILATLSRTTAQADLVKELKRASSIWIKDLEPPISKFGWQSGYGIFSVGQSQIDEVKRYIENQEKHHRTVSFKEEFRLFLSRYEVDFEEQYVWD
jgi:putative transposase